MKRLKVTLFIPSFFENAVINLGFSVPAPKEVAKTAYHIASYSLTVTSMCLHYSSTIVGALCIYLAARWKNWEIQKPERCAEWYHFFGSLVSNKLIQRLADQYDECLSRIKTMQQVVVKTPMLPLEKLEQFRGGRVPKGGCRQLR